MDTEDIQITLRRVHSDLQRVLESRGWLSLLNQIQEPLSLENSLGNALFHSTELKLKVNQILEQRRKCRECLEDLAEVQQKLKKEPKCSTPL